MNLQPDKCPACGAELTGALCRPCLLRAGLGATPTSQGVRWAPPTPGELEAQLTKYQVRELLGQGGMGAVYKGWQTSLERDVAIKVLPPGLLEEDGQFSARFKQEARTMARLSHPAIISVYDFDETADGLCYIVMEYVEGTDVQHMIAREGQLSADHALAIAINVSNALSYAHEHGIIHRDIKPANVMVDTEGRVKVADFGLAKFTQGGATLLTRTNVSLGTPGYFAPEVLTTGMDLDGRADLYSMGVMLYVMLTGKVPQGRFESASARVPGIDRRFDDIVNRAMQPERDARYANAAELLADLTTILTVPLEQASTQFAEAVSGTPLEMPSRESTMRGTPLTGRPSAGGSRTKARIALIGLAAATACAMPLFVWKPWNHPSGPSLLGEGVSPVLPASQEAPDPNVFGPGQIIDLIALPDLDLGLAHGANAPLIYKEAGRLRIVGDNYSQTIRAPVTIIGSEYEMEVRVGNEFGSAVLMRIPSARSFVDVTFNSSGLVQLTSRQKTTVIIPSGNGWPPARPITLKLRVKLGTGGLNDVLEITVGNDSGVLWQGRLADYRFDGHSSDPRPGLTIAHDVKTIESFTLRMILGEAKLLPTAGSSIGPTPRPSSVSVAFAPAKPKPETDVSAPVDFKFTAVDGRGVDLARLRGKVEKLFAGKMPW